tara:strand:+ start:1886 stop:3115 length:1230 start_codon:yes stop_codon:yes gene_type:complete
MLMSNMLEQAIVDAAALREAALKNAEQSIIEKYAPQIKEAVEAMLENETAPTNTRMYQGRTVSVVHEADEAGNVTVSENDGKPFVVNESELSEATENDVLQEEEAQAAADTTTAPPSNIEAPPAWDSRYGETQSVTLNAMLDNVDEDGNIEIDLDSIELALSNQETEATQEPEIPLSLDSNEEEVEAPQEEPQDDLEAFLGDEEEELQLQEMIDMIKNVIEEEIEVDMGEAKGGWIQTDEGALQYEADKQAAHDEHMLEEEEKEDEEKNEALGQVNELHETINALKDHNVKLESAVHKMNDKLEETLLSNAILLYQNRTLNDASLNERQKSKIVEAIGNAESPKEAKNLHETLKATVGSDTKKAPQSLSESVNRKSNLSSMLNRRQNLNERKDSDDSFMKKMQKLAGIK